MYQNLIQPELEKSINKQVSGCTNRVYLYLLRYHYNTGKHAAWPKQSTIAEFLNIDESSVKRAIKQLEKEGYIKVKRTKKYGKEGPFDKNCYTFPFITVNGKGLIVEKGAKCPLERGQNVHLKGAKCHPLTYSKEEKNSNQSSSSSFETTKNDDFNKKEEEEGQLGKEVEKPTTSLLVDESSVVEEKKPAPPSKVGKYIKVNRKCSCGSQIMHSTIYMGWDIKSTTYDLYGKFLVCSACGKPHNIRRYTWKKTDDPELSHDSMYVSVDNPSDHPLDVDKVLREDGTKYIYKVPSKEELLAAYKKLPAPSEMIELGFDFQLLPDDKYDLIDWDKKTPWSVVKYSHIDSDTPPFRIMDKNAEPPVTSHDDEHEGASEEQDRHFLRLVS